MLCMLDTKFIFLNNCHVWHAQRCVAQIFKCQESWKKVFKWRIEKGSAEQKAGARILLAMYTSFDFLMWTAYLNDTCHLMASLTGSFQVRIDA